jgi:hypothetical protein
MLTVIVEHAQRTNAHELRDAKRLFIRMRVDFAIPATGGILVKARAVSAIHASLSGRIGIW